MRCRWTCARPGAAPDHGGHRRATRARAALPRGLGAGACMSRSGLAVAQRSPPPGPDPTPKALESSVRFARRRSPEVRRSRPGSANCARYEHAGLAARAARAPSSSRAETSAMADGDAMRRSPPARRRVWAAERCAAGRRRRRRPPRAKLRGARAMRDQGPADGPPSDAADLRAGSECWAAPRPALVRANHRQCAAVGPAARPTPASPRPRPTALCPARTPLCGQAPPASH